MNPAGRHLATLTTPSPSTRFADVDSGKQATLCDATKNNADMRIKRNRFAIE